MNINADSESKFKSRMLTLSLSDCSNAYILLKGTIKITRAGADTAAIQAGKRNK